MDFVVVGMGLGAIVMLLGLAARDLGPYLRDDAIRFSPKEGSDADVRDSVLRPRPSWRQTCRVVGDMVVAGGAVVLVATLVGLIARVSDRTGTVLVLVASIIGVLAIAGRTALALHTYHGALALVRRYALAHGVAARPPAPSKAPAPTTPVPVVASDNGKIDESGSGGTWLPSPWRLLGRPESDHAAKSDEPGEQLETSRDDDASADTETATESPEQETVESVAESSSDPAAEADAEDAATSDFVAESDVDAEPEVAIEPEIVESDAAESDGAEADVAPAETKPKSASAVENSLDADDSLPSTVEDGEGETSLPEVAEAAAERRF